MRRVASAAVVLATLCVCAGRARADWRSTRGGAWLHYELGVLHDVDEARGAPPATGLLLAGARLHGFVGGPTIAYHVGIDLAAGSTLDRAGFAYDVALFPVGIAVRLGQTGVVAFGAGVGAMGAVGSFDDVVTLPIETTIELGGGRVRVLARLRAAYIAGAEGRQSGARSAPFADELDGMLGLRIGHHYDEYGFPSGNGYWAGLAYRELYDARFVGLVIGYSIDGATPRRTGSQARSTMLE